MCTCMYVCMYVYICVLGMGDINILAYNYCEASISRLSRLLNLLFVLKMCQTAFKCVQIVSANYRLLTKEISRLIGQTG